MTERERQVVGYLLRGASLNLTAKIMGLSYPRVSDLFKNAKRRAQQEEKKIERETVVPVDSPITHKLCNACGEEKPVSEFHKRTKKTVISYQPYCKECKKKQDRERYERFIAEQKALGNL